MNRSIRKATSFHKTAGRARYTTTHRMKAQVLQLLGEGKEIGQVARSLGIRRSTVSRLASIREHDEIPNAPENEQPEIGLEFTPDADFPPIEVRLVSRSAPKDFVEEVIEGIFEAMRSAPREEMHQTIQIENDDEDDDSSFEFAW